jgi:hypothetical protein
MTTEPAEEKRIPVMGVSGTIYHPKTGEAIKLWETRYHEAEPAYTTWDDLETVWCLIYFERYPGPGREKWSYERWHEHFNEEDQQARQEARKKAIQQALERRKHDLHDQAVPS